MYIIHVYSPIYSDVEVESSGREGRELGLLGIPGVFANGSQCLCTHEGESLGKRLTLHVLYNVHNYVYEVAQSYAVSDAYTEAYTESPRFSHSQTEMKLRGIAGWRRGSPHSKTCSLRNWPSFWTAAIPTPSVNSPPLSRHTSTRERVAALHMKTHSKQHLLRPILLLLLLLLLVHLSLPIPSHTQ